MNLLVMSLFRNAQRNIQRYINQFKALEWPYGKKEMLAIENDSTDKTKDLLTELLVNSGYLVSKDMGFPLHGSVVNQERFDNLTTVFNWGVDFIVENLKHVDYVLFIESDLIYFPDLAVELKKATDQLNCITAPMIWTERDRLFYDVWAFRGIEDNFLPVHQQLYTQEGIHEVQSAGSCLMFKRELLEKGIRPTDEALPSFCRMASSKGYKTYVDFSQSIYHPQ